MSHAKNCASPRTIHESSASQLSADAACFVPSTFSPGVSTNLNEIPPYFSNYLWQSPELLDPNLYVRNLEHWSLSQLHAASNMQPSFQFFQYPSAVKMDYPTVVFQENGISDPDVVRDGFYPPSAVTWTDPSLQQNVASPLMQLASVQGFDENFSGISNSTTLDVKKNVSEEGVIIHPKKKKKAKNRKKIETGAQDLNLLEGPVVQTEKNFAKESQNVETAVSSNIEIATLEPKKYCDSGTQTDFSEELSRLTLSEKPNALYDLKLRTEFLQNCFTSGFPATTATNNADTVQAPNSQVLDYRRALTSNPSLPLGLIAHPTTSNSKSGSAVAQRSHEQIVKSGKKSSFDHSSVRSQSGRRKSTGISTSDRAKDDCSRDRQKTKTERSLNNSRNKNADFKDNKKFDKLKHELIVESTKKKTRERVLDADDCGSLAAGKLKSIDGHAKDEIVFNGVKNKAKNSLVMQNSRSGKSRSPSQRNPKVRSDSSGTKLLGLSRSASRGHQDFRNSSSSTARHQSAKSTKPDRIKHPVEDNGSKIDVELPDSELPPGGESKTGKRRRCKRKKKTGVKDGQTEDEINHAAIDAISDSVKSAEMSVLPNFDDDEFPNLTGVQGSKNENSSGPVKYSDILSGRVKTPSFPRYFSTPMKSVITSVTKQEDIEDIFDPDDDIVIQRPSVQMTNTRSMSQPPRSPPKPSEEKKAVGAGKKTKEPITLSIFDMITVKTKNKKTAREPEKNPIKSETKPSKTRGSKTGNLLDSSAVHTRRGKEREVPKPKKPSLLRKVILKERESRRQKFLQECMIGDTEDSTIDVTLVDEESGEDAGIAERRHASAPAHTSVHHRVASVSPCAARPVPASDAAMGAEVSDSQRELLQSLIHSRRFREYCTQVLSPDINSCCTALLTELVRFQDRLYHKDPNKAKLKRRFCLGLREVTKHLKGGKIKCAIISPNLERIQSKGGLDEALHDIINLCQEQNVPFVFALNRKQLGRACCKVVPVSVVGIFSYAGAEEHFSKLKELTEKARESYKEMVLSLKAELDETNQTVPDPSSAESCQNVADVRDDEFENLDGLSQPVDLHSAKEYSDQSRSDDTAISLENSTFEFGEALTSHSDSDSTLVALSSNTLQHSFNPETITIDDDCISLTGIEFDLLNAS